LRGKVVLIDFWTYSCINCLRTLPYVRRWAERYKDHGLVVIGVHTPEFAFEKDEDNVKRALHDLGVTYPVALDNGYAIWRAFDNHYWPAQYFVDAEGRIRDHHFGEGDDARSETVIRSLLTEAGYRDLPDMAGAVEASGVGVAANEAQLASPETYVGYQRAANFASDGGERRDVTFHYAAPAQLDRNQWGLDGAWTVGGERAVLDAAPGAIVFHFRARDLHLVLGPAADGKPVRFRVTLDGAPPGPNHGVDTDEAGVGIVHGQRLYQLIRQQGRVSDRDFAIEFLDPGVAAYAFTFG